MRLPLATLAVLFAVVAFPSGSAAESTEITRRYVPADRVSGRYQYVPFEVPAGTSRIRIEQIYDKANGANAVDLGLLEPGAVDLGSRALRGWSGGARSEIVLTPGGATPGYLPGPLPPGTWHVILGLYKVAPAGVSVTLRISLDGGAAPEPRWYAGDLHLHTVHSDGAEEPARVLDMARAAGLDFVVITDHNNTTHALAVPPDPHGRPLHIVGEEITTPGGHANVWGLRPGDWLDFRLAPGDERIRTIAASARTRGALFAINHPVADCDACDWTLPVPEDTDAVEVWNGGLGPQPGAIAFWDGLLRAGRRVTGVASSDWHRPPGVIGAGSVRVLAASLTERAILDAIEAGAVVMMRDPQAPPPVFTITAAGTRASVGETLDVPAGTPLDIAVTIPAFTSPGLAACPGACTVELTWNGEAAGRVSAGSGTVTFDRPATNGYARITVTSGSTIVALTNPIFVSIR